MRKIKYILLFFLFCIQYLFAQVSIYNIQYTTVPGSDNTYPSLYEGQLVETGGIISGINYSGSSYFISSSAGGSWNGLYIYDNKYSPSIGDSIIISGYIYEYNGLTELKNIQSLNIINSGNELPIYKISTSEINSEKNESVLVKVSDITVSSSYDSWGEWRIDDGSGECIVSTGFYNLKSSGFELEKDSQISAITGIVSYNYNNFRFNPRDLNDFLFDNSGYVISIPSNDFYDMQEIQIPIEISSIDESKQINNYQINFQYNSDIVTYSEFEKTETLSNEGDITEKITDNYVKLNFEGSFNLLESKPLIKLKFMIISSGDADLKLDSVLINNVNIPTLSSGLINIINTDPIGDTLTVIQKPILNIPEIVIPNESMEIICNADKNINNWNTELIYKNIKLNLPIVSSIFDNKLNYWILTTTIPKPDLYELYDLHVTASNEIDDITLNAVNIIPNEKEQYYFIQITDTHLPSHTFYSENQSSALNDTSGIVYLREVIKDINLLNPEFVLLTGDLINEGELEDYKNGRVYTKAQKILTEFEVPVFLQSGNHDLGGWVDTPPSQGTSRRDWWRFFGWKWLQNPTESQPLQTQNYTFDYGSTKFIGMEAYDNYDEYMFDVYGDKSFTTKQINWLKSELENSSEFDTKVLFYHYDFSNQIDLEELGVNMALYGHIHRNEGNINTTPYNLATDNVCDGDRAYRVIKVNNNQLIPQPTFYVHGSEENIDVKFSPSNIGISDSISALISNKQNCDFENAKIKFIMPGNHTNYQVTNCSLYQIDKSGEFNICYVYVDLKANSNINVTIKAIPSTGLNNIHIPGNQLRCFPNPFNSQTTIEYSISKDSIVELSIYNINGHKIKTLVNEHKKQGKYSINWAGNSDNTQTVSAGVYLYEIKAGDFISKKQMVLLK